MAYDVLGQNTSLNMGNAQRLGLGNAQISPVSSLDTARQAAGLKTSVPTSPVTKAPVAAFGSALKSGTTPIQASSAGSYKGFAITPGSDSSIAAQIANIDAGRPTQTTSGSIVSSGVGGGINSPNSFTIDTSGSVPSSVLSSNLGKNDVTSQRKSYADYVMGLSEAQQYSPQYLQALEGVQANKRHNAELTSNFYTGNNEPGATLGYAQGYTTREQALNDIKGLGAAQNLQTMELQRQGNIGAAKALVDAYAPQTVSPGSSLISPVTGIPTYGGAGAYSDYQAQQTYFNLAQQFPDARIPAYDPNMTAQQNLQQAQQLASGSPSFQANNQITFQSPAGGLYIYDKKTGQTQPLISDQQGLAGGAAKQAIQTLNEQKAQASRAVSTADANFPLLISAAQKAGIGETSPLFVNGAISKTAAQLGSANAAALQTLYASLQTEYAAVLNRGGGTLTDKTRGEAENLIRGNFNLSQLRSVYNTLKKESANVLSSYDKEIQNQLHIVSSGSFSGGSSGGSLWDF